MTPSPSEVEAAHDAVADYGIILRDLTAYRAEVKRRLRKFVRQIEAIPEHQGEAECDGRPTDRIGAAADTLSDALGDAMVEIKERVEALNGWLGVHDREEVYP